MQCEDIQEELVSFVLNELGDEEERKIREHISSCNKCSTEIANYSRTLQAMGHWEIPEKATPGTIVFVPQTAVGIGEPKTSRRSIRKYTWVAVRAAFAAFILAVLVFGSQIKYNDGSLTITLGNTKYRSVSPDTAMIPAALQNMQRQNVQLMSEMITASEARQAALYKSSLSSFSRQISDQQRAYIAYIMDHVYRLQQQDQIAYYQSRAALDGVLRLANSVK